MAGVVSTTTAAIRFPHRRRFSPPPSTPPPFLQLPAGDCPPAAVFSRTYLAADTMGFSVMRPAASFSKTSNLTPNAASPMTWGGGGYRRFSMGKRKGVGRSRCYDSSSVSRPLPATASSSRHRHQTTSAHRPTAPAAYLERQVAHRRGQVYRHIVPRRSRQITLQLGHRLGRDLVVGCQAGRVEQGLERTPDAAPVEAPGMTWYDAEGVLDLSPLQPPASARRCFPGQQLILKRRRSKDGRSKASNQAHFANVRPLLRTSLYTWGCGG
jgi:hypothetical protein